MVSENNTSSSRADYRDFFTICTTRDLITAPVFLLISSPKYGWPLTDKLILAFSVPLLGLYTFRTYVYVVLGCKFSINQKTLILRLQMYIIGIHSFQNSYEFHINK